MGNVQYSKYLKYMQETRDFDMAPQDYFEILAQRREEFEQRNVPEGFTDPSEEEMLLGSEDLLIDEEYLCPM